MLYSSICVKFKNRQNYTDRNQINLYWLLMEGGVLTEEVEGILGWWEWSISWSVMVLQVYVYRKMCQAVWYFAVCYTSINKLITKNKIMKFSFYLIEIGTSKLMLWKKKTFPCITFLEFFWLIDWLIDSSFLDLFLPNHWSCLGILM